MHTREEFETLRRKWASEMAQDAGLRSAALDVLVRADRYNWIHQTTWLGEPILQLPQDMFAIQDILFRTRPDYVIEVGVAWGGSLLFSSMLMEVLGGQRVIGIDAYLPDTVRERIAALPKLASRIEFIEGSSTAAAVLSRVASIVGGSRAVMVNLDSAHTHQHVLGELRAYSPFVGEGHYLVCADTVIEEIPPQTHRPRPWGPGDNPRTALQQFLRETDRFEVDSAIDEKLLFTCNPHGYLKCIRDTEKAS